MDKNLRHYKDLLFPIGILIYIDYNTHIELFGVSENPKHMKEAYELYE